MKKVYINILIGFLIVIESITLFLAYKSLDNKVELTIQNEIKDNETFAILLEQEDGSFKESNNTKWPSSDYTYNSTLSGCVDQNGNKLNGILSYNSTTKVASVSTKTTTICYLYFDIIPKTYAVYSETDNSLTFLKSKKNLKSGMEINGKKVTAAYTGFENSYYSYNTETKTSTAPWAEYASKVTSVNFETELQPTRTTAWFAGFTNVASIDLSNLNTSKVIDMARMFADTGYNVSGTFSLTGLDNWVTSCVTGMGGLFYNSGYNSSTWSVGNLSNWDVSNVTEMWDMFNNAGRNSSTWDVGDISDWDTANVKYMHWMFYRAGSSVTNFKLDLSGWDTSNVLNMNGMFYRTGAESSTFKLVGLENWDVSNVTNMGSMFLQTGLNSDYQIDLRGWAVDKVTNYNNFNYEVEEKILAPFAFTKAYAIYTASDRTLTFIRRVCEVTAGSTYNGQTITKVYSNFENAEAVVSPGYTSQQFRDENVAPWHEYSSAITKVVFADEIRPVSTAAWFSDFSNMTSIDLSKLNTMNTTNMSHMFYGCSSLNFVSMNHLDVSKVTSVDRLFRNCTNLKTVDLSAWKTNSLTNMNTMFTGDTNLTMINLTGWDTSKVTNMSYAFSGCKSLHDIFGIEDLIVTNVKDMGRMFYENESLTSLYLGNWVTNSLTDMTNMFYGCKNLSYLNIQRFNTSNVTSMHGSFLGCSSLTTLNLSNFDTLNVERMGNMFSECSSLENLYINFNIFKTSKVYDMEYMFSNCSKLSINLRDLDVKNVLYAKGFNYNAPGVIAPTWYNNAANKGNL